MGTVRANNTGHLLREGAQAGPPEEVTLRPRLEGREGSHQAKGRRKSCKKRAHMCKGLE